MANRKRLQLVNDERTLMFVKSGEACDATATDYGCRKGNDLAECGLYGRDHYCHTDLGACINGTFDYCEQQTDYTGCFANQYDG